MPRSLRARLTFALTGALNATIAMPALAEDDAEVIPESATIAPNAPTTADAATGAWFIELASPPAVKRTDRAQLAKESERRRIARAGRQRRGHRSGQRLAVSSHSARRRAARRRGASGR